MEPTPKAVAVKAPDDDEVPADVPNKGDAPPKLKVGVADLKLAAAEDSPERAAALDAVLVAAPKAKPAPLPGAGAACLFAALAPKEKPCEGETVGKVNAKGVLPVGAATGKAGLRIFSSCSASHLSTSTCPLDLESFKSFFLSAAVSDTPSCSSSHFATSTCPFKHAK